MKNIVLLMRHDLRRATSNVMVTIVLFGLAVIPSLFTWFNVIASWEPFENTGDLKIAVATTDEGYQSDLVPVRINIGDQVVSSLRANDELDWEITSEDDAIEGTKSEEYYAAIILPPDFSADMLNFYADDAQPVKIDYYNNEKKNALAPKITEQGATQVASQINEMFTETLSEAGLNIISSISDFLNDADTQDFLSRLQNHVREVSGQLDSSADTAEMFSSLIASTEPLVNSASQLTTESGRAIRDGADAIGDGVDAAKSLKSTLDEAAGSLGTALTASSESFGAVADDVDDVFAALDEQSGDAAGALNALADRVQTQTDQYRGLRDGLVDTVVPAAPGSAQGAFDPVVSQIDDAIAQQQAVHDRLEDTAADLTAGNAEGQETRQELRGLIAQAKDTVQGAEDAYTGSLQPKLDELAGTLASVNGGITSIGQDLSGTEETLSGDTESLLDALSRAESTTDSVSGSLQDASGRLDELSAALEEAKKGGGLSAVKTVIGGDAQTFAAALSSPVDLNRVPLYPVNSFGTAMTPFYAALGLWVGALLTIVSLRTDISDDAPPDRPPLTITQAYLGRYGVVALIGFLQSTLVSLGSILFVQVEPVHPFLLILACWAASLIFTLIVYTLVASFGNAGKALGVLLLVLQISAAGGGYPLDVLPPWFQAISSWLPATHAINAMRSAIAGIYQDDYWVSLGWLLLFAVPTLLLGLVLRRPMIGYNQRLKSELESTKLL